MRSDLVAVGACFRTICIAAISKSSPVGLSFSSTTTTELSATFIGPVKFAIFIASAFTMPVWTSRVYKNIGPSPAASSSKL